MGTLLVRNGWLVNPNSELPNGRLDIYVVDDRISRIGVDLPIGADLILDASNRVVMPGLIQTHIHLCQTLFRNQANDLALLDWLRKRIWPLEAAHDEDSLFISARLGLAELIKGGTTAIVDMGTLHHTNSIFDAIVESGIRAQSGKVMMDHPENLPEYLRETTDRAIDESVQLLETWHGREEGRIRYGFAPRAAIACTRNCLHAIVQLSQQYGVPIHTHAAETQDEVGLIQEEHNLRNITYLSEVGLCGPNVQIAHCIWLDDEEIADLQRHDTQVLHCPSSNLKLGSGIAMIPEMLSKGINVSLGADGAPCNNNLDAFTEMRLASLIQKPRLGPTAMPAEDSFRLATLYAARAMGLETEIGSIEEGKKADLNIMEIDQPHCAPFNYDDPVSQIVYSSRASDVLTTIVDGKVLMQDRQLLRIDEFALSQSARQAQKRVVERAAKWGTL
jgi:5-methylthioadenosine/S-adenosylhomocysteine deaminase